MYAIEAKYVNKFQCVTNRLPSVAPFSERGGYQLVLCTSVSNRKTTYTDTEAIIHILEWIENDKEEGEDDLVELYGDEAEGRDSDGDGGENSNNNGMETTNLPNLYLPGSSNNSSPLPVEENDFVYATKLLTKTIEENDIEGVIPVVTHAPRKLLTPNRIIDFFLDAALEPDNYDEVQRSLSVKGDNVNEILTGYLRPKSKAGTKNIYWTSEYQIRVDNQPTFR